MLKKFLRLFFKPRVVLRYMRIRLVSFKYVLRYCFKKNIKINNRIIFNQKTIFSGKGVIEFKGYSSIGYKKGGSFHGLVSEFQSRYKDAIIIIHDKVVFNNTVTIVSANKIEINSMCRIGANVLIMDFEAHGTKPNERDKIGSIGEIIIGKNVWIGSNVIILKNVIIGDNSIVAAGSVVIRGVYPANSIIGGNPAKVVKLIDWYII